MARGSLCFIQHVNTSKINALENARAAISETSLTVFIGGLAVTSKTNGGLDIWNRG